MFTGIIKSVGEVKNIIKDNEILKLKLHRVKIFLTLQKLAIVLA